MDPLVAEVEDVDDDDEDYQKLIDEFVVITDTNDALAQMFMQKRKWKLLPAVNDYYEQIAAQPAPRPESACKAQVVELSSDSEADDEHSSPIANKKQKKSDSPNSTADSTAGCSQSQPSPSSRKELIFVTWNTDGIDERNLRIRTEAVIKIVKQIQPDVLFLQEIVPESEAMIRPQLTEYCIFSGKIWKGFPAQYYTLTLVKKETVTVVYNKVVDFELSVMTRNVILTKVLCNGITLNLLNTHLESTKDFASHRMHQLVRIRDLLKEIPVTEAVIVAGDLNMRDKELEETGGLPEGVADVWEATGKRPETRYTWDTMRNDNLNANFGKFKPRCRFDRVLVRDCKPNSQFVAKSFNLIGLERLKPHVCFPSDHWGILSVFNTFGVTGDETEAAVV